MSCFIHGSFMVWPTRFVKVEDGSAEFDSGSSNLSPFVWRIFKDVHQTFSMAQAGKGSR